MEITRHELRCLSDYDAARPTERQDTYRLERTTNGTLYVRRPNGSLYQLSPEESESAPQHRLIDAATDELTRADHEENTR